MAGFTFSPPGCRRYGPCWIKDPSYHIQPCCDIQAGADGGNASFHSIVCFGMPLFRASGNSGIVQICNPKAFRFVSRMFHVEHPERSLFKGEVASGTMMNIGVYGSG